MCVLLALSWAIGAGGLCVPKSTVEYFAVSALVVPVIVVFFRAFSWLRNAEGLREFAEAAVVITALGYLASVLWGSHESFCRIPAVKIAFVRGTPPPSDIRCWIPRGEGGNLSTLVTPNNDTSAYHLLEGPHGCGKTELIKRACHAAGAGVIYVSVPEGVSVFHKVLASAVNFNFNEHVRLWDMLVSPLSPPDAPEDVYEGTLRTLQVITLAAAQLKQERDKPVVLVIDNTAQLARHALSTFELLHDFAKNRADDGTVTVVLSSSEGIVPTIMRGKTTPPHTACALALQSTVSTLALTPLLSSVALHCCRSFSSVSSWRCVPS